MSKKRRDQARPQAIVRTSGCALENRASTDPVRPQPKLAGWRLWAFRLMAMVLVPLVLLACVEGILSAIGYGYPTSFFVKAPDANYYVSNRNFCQQFYPKSLAVRPHPVTMPGKKAAGATRIFILGESAAEGTPDPAFGFARMLEIMLRQQYPNQRFECINVAVRGINSHIVLPIARECAHYDPDLFIVYMGNNENIGIYSPDAGHFNLTPHLNVIRLQQWARATHLGQLIVATADHFSHPQAVQDMDYFRKHQLAADDPARDAVYENYQENLSDILAAIKNSKAKTILCRMAVNLHDCPPVASMHRRDLTSENLAQWESRYSAGTNAEAAGKLGIAIQQYTLAAQVDDHFADLHFRLARCLEATGKAQQAREHYKLARDWDALQFRSDSRQNGIIEKIAAARSTDGVALFDAENALSANPMSESGVPGNKLIFDHVHFTFDGDYAMASALMPSIVKQLKLPESTKPIPSRQDCASRLAYTAWDEFNVLSAAAASMEIPPFLGQLDHEARQQAAGQSVTNQWSIAEKENPQSFISTYQHALESNPSDLYLHINFASLYFDMQNFGASAQEYEKVVDILPHEPRFHLKLANSLRRAGHIDEAIAHIEEAARLEPAYPAVKEALAWANSTRKQSSR